MENKKLFFGDKEIAPLTEYEMVLNSEEPAHSWLWETDDGSADLYCMRCFRIRNFDIDEKDEPPCVKRTHIFKKKQENKND